MPAGSSSYSLGGLWIVQPLPIHICQEKSHDNPAFRNFLNPKILWLICRFRRFCFNTARNFLQTCRASQNVAERFSVPVLGPLANLKTVSQNFPLGGRPSKVHRESLAVFPSVPGNAQQVPSFAPALVRHWSFYFPHPQERNRRAFHPGTRPQKAMLFAWMKPVSIPPGPRIPGNPKI